MNLSKIFALTLLGLLLSACDEKPLYDPSYDSPSYRYPYTKAMIIEAKHCLQVRYDCLTLTHDAQWRETLLNTRMQLTRDNIFRMHLKGLEQLFEDNNNKTFYLIKDEVLAVGRSLKNKVSLDEKVQGQTNAAFNKAAELLQQTKESVLMSESYQMGKAEHERVLRHRKQVMYREITQMLNLFYPGFWGDTPIEEQVQWVMLVEQKKEQFPTFTNSQGGLEVMAHICALIGIDFDTKPQHKPIVTMLTEQKYPLAGWSSQALDYLYFVYLERDYDRGGIHYNRWSLRGALESLPPPERHVPRFSDEVPEEGIYNPHYNLQRIYKDTIREGGRDYQPEDHAPIVAYMKTLKPVSLQINQPLEH